MFSPFSSIPTWNISTNICSLNSPDRELSYPDTQFSSLTKGEAIPNSPAVPI